MSISSTTLTTSTLIVGLALPPSVDAQLGRSSELVCNGSVTYGQRTFSDQVTLRISTREVEISGQEREISTFEGMLQYKICFESQNELDFEYTTAEKCGINSTRAGRLNKVLGNLRLSRSDRGERFVGEYSCKPAQRVLK